jgi:hypothetical protein
MGMLINFTGMKRLNARGIETAPQKLQNAYEEKLQIAIF